MGRHRTKIRRRWGLRVRPTCKHRIPQTGQMIMDGCDFFEVPWYATNLGPRACLYRQCPLVHMGEGKS